MGVPGGKVGEDEAPAAALAREIAEELSLQVAVGDYLGRGLGGPMTLYSRSE